MASSGSSDSTTIRQHWSAGMCWSSRAKRLFLSTWLLPAWPKDDHFGFTMEGEKKNKHCTKRALLVMVTRDEGTHTHTHTYIQAHTHIHMPSSLSFSRCSHPKETYSIAKLSWLVYYDMHIRHTIPTRLQGLHFFLAPALGFSSDRSTKLTTRQVSTHRQMELETARVPPVGLCLSVCRTMALERWISGAICERWDGPQEAHEHFITQRQKLPVCSCSGGGWLPSATLLTACPLSAYGRKTIAKLCAERWVPPHRTSQYIHVYV